MKPMSDGYKFGLEEQKIAVEQFDPLVAHMNNFLDCMRSRQKPHLDVETGACAQVLITAAVESYRQGRCCTSTRRSGRFRIKPAKG